MRCLDLDTSHIDFFDFDRTYPLPAIAGILVPSHPHYVTETHLKLMIINEIYGLDHVDEIYSCLNFKCVTMTYLKIGHQHIIARNDC